MHHAGLVIAWGQVTVTGSSGRFCHSAIPSRTMSVMLEMVYRDTSAP